MSKRVPLSLAGPVNDLDKSGNACIVFDACCHTSVLEKCVNDIDYKMFIIELAIEWVENKHQVKLSRGNRLLAGDQTTSCSTYSFHSSFI